MGCHPEVKCPLEGQPKDLIWLCTAVAQQQGVAAGSRVGEEDGRCDRHMGKSTAVETALEEKKRPPPEPGLRNGPQLLLGKHMWGSRQPSPARASPQQGQNLLLSHRWSDTS